MSMPGFTAAASVYNSRSAYRAAYRGLAINRSIAVTPEQLRFDVDPCENFCQIHVNLPCLTGCIASSVGLGLIGNACERACRPAHEECVAFCNAGDGALPFPSGRQICSDEACPPVGTLPCCRGFRCVSGSCLPNPPQGTSTF
jgi:hypothetical protein